MAGGRFAGGNGTSASPFLIEDAHDFNAIRIYYDGYYFKLIKDINMNIPPYNAGEGWSPIPVFNSKIDGDGHKVSSLSVRTVAKDTGIFLKSGIKTQLVNLHFEDVYMEMLSDDVTTASKIFTLFGLSFNSSDGGSGVVINFIKGCSITAKFKVEHPNAVTRLLVREAQQFNYNIIKCIYEDLYMDLENVSSKSIDILMYSTGSSYSSLQWDMKRAVLKTKGNFRSYYSDISTNTISISDFYYIDQPGSKAPTKIIQSYPNYVTVEPEFLSIPENIPVFREASHNGRQVWYFPGNTHLRMVDSSRNKFLIEADGEVFTYNTEDGLKSVGSAPVVINMFTEDGIDYIESVPVNAWNQLRTDFGTVDIHCYVEKIPGKSAVTNSESLNFSQALENKVVLRTAINFADHNNDINRIRIPSASEEVVETEPIS